MRYFSRFRRLPPRHIAAAAAKHGHLSRPGGKSLPPGHGNSLLRNSTLQNFLNTLLQNLQANGVQSPSSVGAAVNTRV